MSDSGVTARIHGLKAVVLRLLRADNPWPRETDSPDLSSPRRARDSRRLLGAPYRLVIGNNFRETGELETRDVESRYITRSEVPDVFE